MKVLIPVHLFPPFHRAGVESYTLDMARALSRHAQVTVATTRKVISLPTGTIRRRRHAGLDVIEVINNHACDDFRETWENPAMERAFETILDEVDPDVVHFQHLMYWSVRCPGMARKKGCRVFLTLHDFWLMCSRFGQLISWDNGQCADVEENRCATCMAVTPFGQPAAARRWIERLVSIRRWTGIPLDAPMRWLRSLGGGTASPGIPAAPSDESVQQWKPLWRDRQEAFRSLAESVDRIITPSEALRGMMLDWGLPADSIVRVPQGLDAGPFEGLASRSNQPGGPLRLAFVGQVVPHKGLHLLLEAVSRMSPEEVRLVVHGPEDHRPDYVEQCRRQAESLPHVTFGGLLERERLPALYRDVDVLCTPSTWNECCPLAIQEAFMAGTPAVVTGIGGMAELVEHEVSGLHVQCGDVDDWERSLRRLVDEPDLLKRLTDGVPSVPTVEEHVDVLLNLYRDGE